MASYCLTGVLCEGIVRFLPRKLFPVLAQCVGEVVDRIYEYCCGRQPFRCVYLWVRERERMQVQVVLPVEPEEPPAKIFGNWASAVVFDLIFRPDLVAKQADALILEAGSSSPSVPDRSKACCEHSRCGHLAQLLQVVDAFPRKVFWVFLFDVERGQKHGVAAIQFPSAKFVSHPG